ncbi:MAG: Tim44-like domain-containing protein [Burkholderiales bacterium]
MMHRLMAVFSAVMLGFALGVTDAEAARRLGGGKNLGQQRESIQREQVAPKPPAQAPAAAPQSAPGARPGFGMLGGLLAGGLIGALLFGGAFEGIKIADVAMFALVALGAWLLFRSLARSRAPASGSLQPAGGGGPLRVEPQGPIARREVAAPVPASSATPAARARNIPADFDADGFLKHARRAFVQLQAANDARDLAAIRDFTTPELYAALESEIGSRGAAPQQVNAVTLNAALLDVTTENNAAVASVLFSGYLREDGDGLPQEFEEIWHVTKDLGDPKSVWLLAGIQQVA